MPLCLGPQKATRAHGLTQDQGYTSPDSSRVLGILSTGFWLRGQLRSLVVCCQEGSNSSSYKVRVPTDPFIIAPAHRAMLYLAFL